MIVTKSIVVKEAISKYHNVEEDTTMTSNFRASIDENDDCEEDENMIVTNNNTVVIGAKSKHCINQIQLAQLCVTRG